MLTSGHTSLAAVTINHISGRSQTATNANTSFNGSSTASYVGYVSDPNGRGTTSLILSCFLTLVLCVWSALHLNVPARRRTIVQVLWLNVRWIFAGIYAPELVVFVAWRQWCSARLLQQHIEGLHVQARHHGGDSFSESRSDGPPPWTMAHSFFACAGGFAIELDALRGVVLGQSDQPEESNGEKAQAPPRLTLTARGVMLLAKSGFIPRATKAEIEDKSKANDLAKATVLVQATWMLVQVIARLAAHLPVTLLEVNTVAHVLCAFAMYIFWWHKPLLPNEPIILRDESLAPLVAFMYASSEVSGRVSREHIKSQTFVKTLFANLNLYSTTPELEMLSLVGSREAIEGDGNRVHGAVAFVKDDSLPSAQVHLPTIQLPGRVQRAPAACLRQLEATRQKEQGTAFFERRPRVIPSQEQVIDSPSSSDLARWSLIQEAFQKHSTLLLDDRILLSHAAPGPCSCLHLRPEQLVATNIPNWPSNNLLRSVNGLVVGMILWLANLCYGGFHAAAWNDHFPSVPEKWLWRASSSYIGFCGGFWVILNSAVARWPALNAFWEKWMDGEKSLAQSIGLGAVVFTCGFSLMLARMYVVVEAFISIRELPVEAYNTPEWADLFPHF
ncbi:family c-likeg-protein-coupled receptor protein [Purpureocillium lavendulum]|uniref:Family c-likeg-protein-coupled receptor protein n=1 Tax=Purpureocillium lavendulum TaxID=1247861 RepID=A0AB34FZC0_9HYPO|nr:family c-likeg-protein-coupled receptor protein [Purpureocillium lavendulum]